MAKQRFGNSEKINTTTSNIIKIYNDDGSQDASALGLNLWNNLMILDIIPAIPKDQRDGNKTYDYDNKLSLMFEHEHLILIKRAFEKIEAFEIKAKKSKSKDISPSYCIPAKKEGYLEIGPAGTYDGITNYFVGLYITDDQGEVIDDHLFIFPTSKLEPVVDMHEKKFGKGTKVQAYWTMFKNIIETLSTTGVGLSIHQANIYNNYKFTKAFNLLETIKGLIEMLISSGGGKVPSGGGSGGSNNGGSKRRNGFKKRTRHNQATVDENTSDAEDGSIDDVDSALSDDIDDLDE